MDLVKVSVKTSHEAVDAVSNILMEQGATGVQIDDRNDYEVLKREANWDQYELGDSRTDYNLNEAQVSAYFKDKIDVDNVVKKVKNKVGSLNQFGLDPGPNLVSVKSVKDEDWATSWEKYYHPERVTRFLTVVPSWEDYDIKNSDELMVRLDPGMAFGTGTHPTTKLAMQALEMTIRGDEIMLDVGTGSGVLSIAARELGAGTINAYDVDDVAVKSAEKNIALNPGMQEIQVKVNNLLDGINIKADVVVANILAEIIIPLIPQAEKCLNDGGIFITSGIIADKLDEVVATLKKHHFKINQVLTMKDWRSVIAEKVSEEN